MLDTRRCSAFVGVSATASVIENGTDRLGLGRPPFTRDQLAQINTRTCQRALDRSALRDQWQDALKAGTVKQMTDGLKAPEESLPHGFIVANTIAALLIQAGYAFVATVEYLGRGLGRVRGVDFWSFLELVLGVAAVVSLPWSFLALWRFIRHGTPERSIKQIGRAVLESLEYEGSIDRHAGDFRVTPTEIRMEPYFAGLGAERAKSRQYSCVL